MNRYAIAFMVIMALGLLVRADRADEALLRCLENPPCAARIQAPSDVDTAGVYSTP